MRAMGPQAATALRLVVDPSVPVIPARPIRRLADGLPDDWEPLGMTDAARTALRAQDGRHACVTAVRGARESR